MSLNRHGRWNSLSDISETCEHNSYENHSCAMTSVRVIVVVPFGQNGAKHLQTNILRTIPWLYNLEASWVLGIFPQGYETGEHHRFKECSFVMELGESSAL